MVKEIYTCVPGFEFYEVSDHGNVRNNKTTKILKPCKFKNSGYLYVDLCKSGIKHRKLVHRLVLSTYNSNEQKDQVNHINGIKTDNRLSNLEWCTKSENQKHSIKIGLRHTRGENNSQAKLTEKEVLMILKDNRNYSIISKEYCISIPTISDIKRGYSWTHITGLIKNNQRHEKKT